MTRKDYVALASAIRQAKPDEYAHYPLNTWGLVAANIADVLQADNRAFDHQRFMEACGLLAGWAKTK